jgi:hypothetical protein
MKELIFNKKRTEAEEEAWRSKAVIANPKHGGGCILWYIGGSLANEIEECGLYQLSDLGLDDAPPGISVWEGTFVWQRGPYEHPNDGDMLPSGKFREPTPEEWFWIIGNRNPWDAPYKVDTRNHPR